MRRSPGGRAHSGGSEIARPCCAWRLSETAGVAPINMPGRIGDCRRRRIGVTVDNIGSSERVIRGRSAKMTWHDDARPLSVLNRRQAFSVIAGAGVTLIARHANADVVRAPPHPLRHQVFVDGTRSGTLNIEFVPRLHGFTVISSMSIRVEVLFVTAYRYQQDAQEDWERGRLVAFEYVTNDDGATSHVSARREGDGFLVTGPNGNQRSEVGAAAPSFWNIDIVKRSLLVNPQSGEVVPLTIQPLKQQSVIIAHKSIHGHGYGFDTFVKGAAWFDSHHQLLAITFEKDGHKVEAIRR
jgi:hypothetical protein